MDRRRKNLKRIIRCFVPFCACLIFCPVGAKASWGRGEDRIQILIELREYAQGEQTRAPETEFVTETEVLTGAESGTETEVLTGAESGTETERESLAEPESEESGGRGDGTAESEKTADAFTIPEDLESRLAQLSGIETNEEEETETETEIETETETETETEEEPDETALAAEEMLEEIQLGEDFVLPMQMPEELGTLPEPPSYHCGKLPMDRIPSASGKGSRKGSQSIRTLEDTVTAMVSTYDGDWSVYFKNLNTDESFLLNDMPMKSASIMKLFIMGTVYTEIEKGELSRTDEIVELLNKMITFSDNEASNELLYILGNSSYAEGISQVNRFIQDYGYSEMTVEYNGFNNPDTVLGDGVNQVAAKDVGKLLEDVYRRTWMSRAASNEVESMLLAQDTRYKIPAGLPEDVLCANKTGEMDETENDAAIVYSDNCDYILVILSSDWDSADAAVDGIRALSALTYEFFNG